MCVCAFVVRSFIVNNVSGSKQAVVALARNLEHTHAYCYVYFGSDNVKPKADELILSHDVFDLFINLLIQYWKKKDKSE